jgi:hypothetical protein
MLKKYQVILVISTALQYQVILQSDLRREPSTTNSASPSDRAYHAGGKKKIVRDQFRLLTKMQINWALAKAEAASLYLSFHLKVKVKPAVILLVSRDTIIRQLMRQYSCLKNVSFATLSENKMYLTCMLDRMLDAYP